MPRRYRGDLCTRRARRRRLDVLEEDLQLPELIRPGQEGGTSMSPFKDLAELHVAAVESGQPEMFKTVLGSVRWASSLSPPIRGSDDDDTSQPERLAVVKFAERPAPAPREF